MNYAVKFANKPFSFLALTKTSCLSLRSMSNITVNAEASDMPVSMKNPYEKEPRKCVLCKYKIKVDYKNTKLLSQFVSPFTGFIYDKHITGLCDKQQKIVKNEIRKAQAVGLMPYVLKEPKFLKDPKLFDPTRPQRPHPY